MPNDELVVPDEPVDAEPAVRGAVLPALMPDQGTDLHNAWALTLFGDGRVPGAHKVRWAPGLGWLYWDGKRWRHDEGDVHVYQTAKLAILFMNATNRDGDDDEKLSKWLHQSQNRGRIASMVELARTEPSIVAYVDELDARPGELNTQNGILDLKTLELREHDPAAMHTRVTSAGYDPDARAPFWTETIGKALPDPAVRRYVQKMLGQSLRGTYSENLLVAHGQTGSNLKSTMFGAVRDCLGDYAATASSDLLVDQASGSARSDTALAALRGVRLVTAFETAEGVPLHDALVKLLTGEHQVTAKFMRMDYFTFQNQSTVVLATNHRPRVQSGDEAIWRRLVLVPFEYKVKDGERIDQAEAESRMRREQNGILAWLVEGLRMWREEGLRDVPTAIAAATAGYRHDSDPMAEWLEDAVTFEDGAHERVTLVRSTYESHCQASGRQPLGVQRFNATLERRGAKRGSTGPSDARVKSWFGLRLKTS